MGKKIGIIGLKAMPMIRICTQCTTNTTGLRFTRSCRTRLSATLVLLVSFENQCYMCFGLNDKGCQTNQRRVALKILNFWIVEVFVLYY